jgi:glutaredoxin
MALGLILLFTLPAWAENWVRVPDPKEQASPGRSRQGAPTDRQGANTKQRAYTDIRVTMYRTEWCTYCNKANEYLNSLGVTLIEYDIERDSAKAEEMHNKGGKGVPLIDVEGIVIKGYSVRAIKDAVEKKRNGG